MASVQLDGVQAQTLVNPGERKAGEKRKALCIGIQYAETATRYGGNEPPPLQNTHNDPKVMKQLLTEFFGFEEKDIRIMRDVYGGKHTIPTKSNILKAIKKLIRDAQAGDHFVFYFSGHGSQVPNQNPDEDPEEDGMDEVIWPADAHYDQEKPNGEEVTNYILDDELKKYLVDSLPDKTHLTVILDCCHSGTGVDLPHSKSDDTIDGWSPTSPDSPNGNSFANYQNFSVPTPDIQASSKMKLAYSAHAQVTKSPCGTEDHAHMGAIKETESDVGEQKLVTSWSACVDKELGVDGPKGGILTQAIDHVLRKKHVRTYRELMHAISKDMVVNLRDAREDAIRDNWHLNCPKPVLGSNIHLDKIYDKPFTF